MLQNAGAACAGAVFKICKFVKPPSDLCAANWLAMPCSGNIDANIMTAWAAATEPPAGETPIEPRPMACWFSCLCSAICRLVLRNGYILAKDATASASTDTGIAEKAPSPKWFRTASGNSSNVPGKTSKYWFPGKDRPAWMARKECVFRQAFTVWSKALCRAGSCSYLATMAPIIAHVGSLACLRPKS